jgi:hypothetical protein
LEDRFRSALITIYHERRLFATEKGFLGIGPWTLQESDAIILVAGADIPYAFRQDKGTNRWRLIGEAYIHGLLNGEASQDESLKFEMLLVK